MHNTLMTTTTNTTKTRSAIPAWILEASDRGAEEMAKAQAIRDPKVRQAEMDRLWG